MQSTVAFVMAIVMFATPVTQVLAQTPQQQDVPLARNDVPVAQPIAPDVTLMPPLRLLPAANPMDVLLPPPNLALAVALHAGADDLPPAPIAKALKIGLIVVGILIVAFLIAAGSYAVSGTTDLPLR